MFWPFRTVSSGSTHVVWFVSLNLACSTPSSGLVLTHVRVKKAAGKEASSSRAEMASPLPNRLSEPEWPLWKAQHRRQHRWTLLGSLNRGTIQTQPPQKRKLKDFPKKIKIKIPDQAARCLPLGPP